MNWIRILNKIGLTSFRSDPLNESDLQFSVLRSPVLLFLNNVGLIVVPSEILPSNPRLRTLHRYLFVGSSVVLFALATYIRLASFSPSVKPPNSDKNVLSVSPTTPPATKPSGNQSSITAAQTPSNKNRRRRSISAKTDLGQGSQQSIAKEIPVPTKRESIEATQNPGNLAPTIGREVTVVANPDPIMRASVSVVGPRLKSLQRDNYTIDISVWSEHVEDEALTKLLTAVAGTVDASVLSTVMKDGAFIQFLILSTGSVKPESIYIKVKPEDDPRVEEIKKVLTNTTFALPSPNDGSDWDVSMKSNNIRLVPDSQQ